MPRTHEQYELIRENRKNQILDTALDLFSNEGYDGVSISRIAAQAGISKGLIYNYFPSKEAMLLAIVNRSTTQIAGFFDPDHDGVLTQDELHYLIDAVFATVADNINSWRLLTSLILQPQIIEKSLPELRRVFQPHLAILQAYFESKGYADPSAQAHLFIALIDGVAIHYIQNPEKFPLERVKKMIHLLFQ